MLRDSLRLTGSRKQERVLPIGARVTVTGERAPARQEPEDVPAVSSRAAKHNIPHPFYIRPHPYAPPPPPSSPSQLSRVRWQRT